MEGQKMNERIQELMLEAGKTIPGDKHIDADFCKKFAELIIKECTDRCGSQADQRNLLTSFGFEVESNIKYSAPERNGSIKSQYEREYNLPKGATNERSN